MLQYLADRGNAFAKQRFQEVQSVWDHLTAIISLPEPFDTQSELQDFGVQRSQVAENINPQSQTRSALAHNGGDRNQEGICPSTPSAQAWVTSMWNNMPDRWASTDAIGEDLSMCDLVAGIPLDDSFDQHQSLLNDPDWTLTGQDVADFAELRRHLL